MTAHEMAGVCIAAAVGLLFIAPAAFDRWHKPRSARRFQRTARKAARTPRTEAEVQAELEEARRLLDERECDLEFSRIIAAEFPTGIPHQTRRTEEDQ